MRVLLLSQTSAGDMEQQNDSRTASRREARDPTRGDPGLPGKASDRGLVGGGHECAGTVATSDCAGRPAVMQGYRRDRVCSLLDRRCVKKHGARCDVVEGMVGRTGRSPAKQCICDCKTGRREPVTGHGRETFSAIFAAFVFFRRARLVLLLKFSCLCQERGPTRAADGAGGVWFAAQYG